MNLLDTSFLFALLFEQDHFHLEAKRQIAAHQDEFFYVSFLVFQELMTLIMAKLGSEMASRVSSDLLATDSPIQFLNIDADYFEDTLMRFRQASPHKLSWVDVSLLTLKENLDARVWTFDAALYKMLEGS